MTARTETAEKLRKMSRGSFSLMKFNTLRNQAKLSIGIAFEETEIIIKQLVNDIVSFNNKNDQLDALLEPLILETAPQIITIPGVGYRAAGLLLGEIGDVSRFTNPEK